MGNDKILDQTFDDHSSKSSTYSASAPNNQQQQRTLLDSRSNNSGYDFKQRAPANASTVSQTSSPSSSILRLPFSFLNRFLPSWQWIPTNSMALDDAEKRLLRSVKSVAKFKYVPIWQSRLQLWMAVFQHHRNKHKRDQGDKTPLVLVHGFGGGIGLWVKNIDALCCGRTLYALDLLGFGKSSRPRFSNDPALVEMEWVQSLEDFRKEAKIDKMILLGHSLGGYLATSYAIEHPDRVRHLILVDPWGFGTKSPDSERAVQVPGWVKTVAVVAGVLNPLSVLRAIGPFGPGLLKRLRPDIGAKYTLTGDDQAIFDYIYHCNAQAPSGESAFKTLHMSFGWAKRPMIERIPQLKSEVPMTFIYGSRSWIDCGPGYEIQQQIRMNSYVRVEVISGSGHHVYADHPEIFNGLVNEVCDLVDTNEDFLSTIDELDDVTNNSPSITIHAKPSK